MNKINKISIGILAHNESKVIEGTLQSLFAQTLITQAAPDVTIEIIVVPNGCKDDTADVSRKALEKLKQQVGNPAISIQVCEVQKPGKCNAWNEYVHGACSLDADYIFLMDADIRFIEPETLQNMVQALEDNPNHWVSIDTPLKDVRFKQKKTLLEQLSILVSPTGKAKSLHISGQLYCARAEKLRKIHFPSVLSAEDDFLTHMICTNLYTEEQVPLEARIVRAEPASHIFEAYTNPWVLLKHEHWLVVSLAINEWMCDYLRQECGDKQDAGMLIARLETEDPGWLQKLVEKNIKKSGWWLLPEWMTLRRFRFTPYKNPIKWLIFLPVTLGATVMDYIVYWWANQDLHQGKYLGYHGKQQQNITSVAPSL